MNAASPVMAAAKEQLAVLVGGGSQGLGLAVALEAARRRRPVGLIGRDAGRLQAAAEKVAAAGATDVATFAIDLSQTVPAVQLEAIADWARRCPVGVAVAAVGRSDRGRLIEVDESDLLAAFESNLMTAFRFSCLSVPLLAGTRGTLVHIGSLAGIIPAAGLGTYCVSKSALVAMSRQLRQELAVQGIHVLTVCPGPIARPDAGRRYDDLASARGLDASARQPGGGVKLSAIDPAVLAGQILEAADARRAELVMPSKAKWLAALVALWPVVAERIIRRKFGT